MTGERAHQIREIVQSVMTLPAGDREAAVADRSIDEQLLQRETLALLVRLETSLPPDRGPSGAELEALLARAADDVPEAVNQLASILDDDLEAAVGGETTAEDRARLVASIVEELRSLSSDEQKEAVRDRCGDDDRLRIEVETALARLAESPPAAGPGREDFERLLSRARAGDPAAVERFWTVVYDDMRDIAAQMLARWRRGPGIPQTTSLVNRVVLRLLEGDLPAKNAAYFFGAVRLAMRRILIEIVRVNQFPQGGHELLDRITSRFGLVNLSIRDLRDKLAKFERLYPRAAEVVYLRDFMDLTVRQTAQALVVGDRLVEKEYAFAKAWLRGELE